MYNKEEGVLITGRMTDGNKDTVKKLLFINIDLFFLIIIYILFSNM